MINDFYIGNAVKIPLTFQRNGEALDITGANVIFCLKKNLYDENDDAAILKIVTTHIDAAAGETEITLTSEDTQIEPGNYHWEIMIILPIDGPKTIRTGSVNAKKGPYDVV